MKAIRVSSWREGNFVDSFFDNKDNKLRFGSPTLLAQQEVALCRVAVCCWVEEEC